MSMNLYVRLPRTRTTDDTGRLWFDLPYQINTNDSYRLLFEDYHWVGNERKHHKELRRSSFTRTLNKYREYLYQRIRQWNTYDEWVKLRKNGYSMGYRQHLKEEKRWIIAHLARIAELGKEGATWEAG